MSASNPVSAKQLKEHLLDQQEPFTLHGYLSERKYMVKSLSNHRYQSHHSKCRGYDLDKIRGLLDASRILRSVHKFVSADERNKSTEEHSRCVIAKDQFTEKRKRYSFMKRLAAYHFWENIDVEDCLLPCEHLTSSGPGVVPASKLSKMRKLEAIKIDTGNVCHWMSIEDPRKQIYSGSKLKESPANEASVVPAKAARNFTSQFKRSRVRQCNTSIGSPLFLASVRKLLVNSQDIDDAACPRRRIERTKQLSIQLLFDHADTDLLGRKEDTRHIVALKETKVGRNTVYKQMLLLLKQHSEFRGIVYLSKAESSIGFAEWRNFQKFKRKIGKDIAERIMDDICKEI